MTGPIISEATSPTDIEAVRQLCWAYWDFLLNNSGVDRQITETFYPEAKYADLMAALPEIHARPRGIMLLARSASGEAIGCGMSHALDRQTSEIKRVFVKDSARGAGIARQICEQLIDQAREDGFTRIVLDTSKNLFGAQALYDSLGFSSCGPYQPIPEDVLPELLFYDLAL